MIALEVLGRNSSFDSKTDPIVRVEAGRLRCCYEAKREEDEALISFPKGRYVPEFAERQPRHTPKSTRMLRLSILPPENAPLESARRSSAVRSALCANLSSIADRNP